MTDLFHFISFCVDHINTANHHFSLHNKINSGFNYKVTGLDQIGKIHMIPLHLTLASLSSLTLNVLLIPVAFSCCPLCLTAKQEAPPGGILLCFTSGDAVAVFVLGASGCCGSGRRWQSPESGWGCCCLRCWPRSPLPWGSLGRGAGHGRAVTGSLAALHLLGRKSCLQQLV